MVTFSFLPAVWSDLQVALSRNVPHYSISKEADITANPSVTTSIHHLTLNCLPCKQMVTFSFLPASWSDPQVALSRNVPHYFNSKEATH